ncbi:MAG: hypothetical protein ACI8RD_010372, partial [Bacillariaceae sp.]|jgi:hypothetical protein
VPIVKKNKDDLNRLKIPTPVFVVSLPKSRTMKVHTYFNCGLGARDCKLLPSVHPRHPVRKSVTWLMRLDNEDLEADFDQGQNKHRYRQKWYDTIISPKISAAMMLKVEWDLPLLSNRPFELLAASLDASKERKREKSKHNNNHKK